MLARGDEGGRATVRNARLAGRFRAASYELGTSLELARFMRNSATAYTKFNLVPQECDRCDRTTTCNLFRFGAL